jgi:hypothetical protein
LQTPNIHREKSMTLVDLSSIVAAIVALLGFPLIFVQLRMAGQQRRDAIKLSGTQVLLALDAVLAVYQDISRNLRPGGGWYCPEEHPTDNELPLVEPYLGLFERLWIAYSVGQIDIATIEHLYGYRLRNIWLNKRLVETKFQHKQLRKHWSMIIALTHALEAEAGGSFTGHTDDWFPPEWLALHKGKDARK